MNEITPLAPHGTTQAAEGLQRIKWTHMDLDRMVEAGLLGRGDHVELIGGEIVPMSPKGNRHERLRHILANEMHRQLAQGRLLLAEPGWRPDKHAYFEPDILVIQGQLTTMEIPGSEVLLLIEIADTSLAYDSTTKRDAYAQLGVREYWIINAADLSTKVHREPSATGYARSIVHAADGLLTPTLVPEVAVRLADLGID